MLKRVTLLRRRPDLTDAEFRRHWAEPHAAIARGFDGLVKYNQNRVDAVCYRTSTARFEVDGIVELWFSSQAAVDANQTSATTLALIEDEPRFLSGLTALTAGEAWATEAGEGTRKLMILAIAPNPAVLRQQLGDLLQAQLHADGLRDFAIEELNLAFTRPSLWSEPAWPNLVVTIWVDDGAAAEDRFFGKNAAFRSVLDKSTTVCEVHAIDELQIV